jgi:hypothetical protein
MLRHYVNPVQDDWDEFLTGVEFAYNSFWQESVRNTPFVLNYGQQPRIPISGNSMCQVSTTQNFVEHMTHVIGEAKKHLIVAQQRQKFYTDKNRREVSFEVDQQVLVSTANIKLKVLGARKLLPRWIGPFRVVQRIGMVAYRVQPPDTFKIHDVFHVSLLRPYVVDGKVQPSPPQSLRKMHLMK